MSHPSLVPPHHGTDPLTDPARQHRCAACTENRNPCTAPLDVMKTKCCCQRHRDRARRERRGGGRVHACRQPRGLVARRAALSLHPHFPCAKLLTVPLPILPRPRIDNSARPGTAVHSDERWLTLRCHSHPARTAQCCRNAYARTGSIQYAHERGRRDRGRGGRRPTTEGSQTGARSGRGRLL